MQNLDQYFQNFNFIKTAIILPTKFVDIKMSAATAHLILIWVWKYGLYRVIPVISRNFTRIEHAYDDLLIPSIPLVHVFIRFMDQVNNFL